MNTGFYGLFYALIFASRKTNRTISMTNGTIERFLESAALKLPAIIKPRLENRTAREVYDDYAYLNISLPEDLSIEEFCDELSESYGTTVLYHHMRSLDTDYGHSVCAFQEPGTGVMFQLCASTDSRGKITEADVKVFFSLERMLAELRATLRRAAMQTGRFAYGITDEELLSLFF